MTKTKFTLGQLDAIYLVLKNLQGSTTSEFNYFVNANYYAIEIVLRAVNKMRSDAEKTIEKFSFEKKILLEKYSNKDENGNPKVRALSDKIISYDIQGNEEALQKDMDVLNKNYAKDLDTYNNQLKDIDSILLKTVPESFIPEMISNKFVPEMDTQQHRIIFPLITK